MYRRDRGNSVHWSSCENQKGSRDQSCKDCTAGNSVKHWCWERQSQHEISVHSCPSKKKGARHNCFASDRKTEEEAKEASVKKETAEPKASGQCRRANSA
uniref:Uncharacterized protein n=1 Tax=Opuntia streptacantha TaxID=393608 RepID=A0A7C9AZU5_OPUST